MNTLNNNIRKYTLGDVEVVAASGEIDVLNIDGFKHPLASASESAEKLVVDLREVNYIDSAGLEQLIIAFSRQSKRGRPFSILIKKGSQPDQVLHVVQIHTLTKVTFDPAEVGLEG